MFNSGVLDKMRRICMSEFALLKVLCCWFLCVNLAVLTARVAEVKRWDSGLISESRAALAYFMAISEVETSALMHWPAA